MDSLHSEDETSGGRPEYDSDEFADDEGMSNQGDSSSQEYLDDPVYCDDEKYQRLPPGMPRGTCQIITYWNLWRIKRRV